MQVQKQIKLKVSSKQLIILSQLFLNKEYPHNFMNREEVSKILDCSRATVDNVMEGLQKKGYITKERGFITFYYPTARSDIRRAILYKIGLLK